jgi:toxin ParE1/3/4
MPRVLKTPEAELDLVEIAAYIEADNPPAAERLLDHLDEKLRLLSEFPGLGRAREELAESLRSFPVGKYVIFYLPLSDGINVIRVLHGSRNIRRLMFRGGGG